MYKQRIEYFYESPEQFLGALNTRELPEGLLSDCNNSSGTDSRYRKWAGTADYSEAMRKAIEGDQEVAKQIQPKDIHLANHGALASTVYDVSGCSVDVGRYLSGEPECMATRRRKGKPIVNILVNIGVSADIDPEVVRGRGRAVLEIMSGLEANGYGVQITLIAETACGGYYLTREMLYRVQIKVKGSGEYFNPVSLAYWLTCPSVLRRLNFRHREGEPADIQEKIGPGYGSTADVPKEELDTMQDCIYFGAIESNDTGQYTRAIEQIMEQYKA